MMFEAARVGIRLLISLLLIVQAAPVAAATPVAGVWQGMIGTLPIRACFGAGGEFGGYYYLSRLRQIPLEAVDASPGQFQEGGGDGKGAPRWTIDRADDKAIEGSWALAARTLSIRLTRVPASAKSDESPCGSIDFNRPRLAGIRVVETPAVKDGLRYTVRHLDLHDRFEDTSVQTIALVGSSPAIRRINAVLAEPLEAGPYGPGTGGDGWLSCVTGSSERLAYEGQIHQDIAMKMVTPRFVTVVDHGDYYCGGPHPDSFDNPRAFDRRDGREVKLLDWLNDKAVVREKVGSDTLVTVRPAFRKLLLARWTAADADCRDTIETQDFWSVELTRTGLTFTPDLPHVSAACGEDFPVSFGRLAPYLNAAGKAGVAALRGPSGGPTQRYPIRRKLDHSLPPRMR